MPNNLDRLHKGERWVTAEAVLRSVGALLLAGSYRLGLAAHRWATIPPPHQATLGEFTVCLAITVCLTSGLALTLFGPKLFEHVPIPARSAYHWRS